VDLRLNPSSVAAVQVEGMTGGALATGADTIVVGIFDGEGLDAELSADALQPLLDRGEARATFKHLAVAHADGRRVILIGLGGRVEFGDERARVAAAVAHERACELATRTLCWQVPARVDDGVAAAIVQGTLLHAYRFDRYRPVEGRQGVERLVIVAADDLSQVVHEAAVLTTAQNRARDLGNIPGNDLTPVALAEYATGLAHRYDGVTVTALNGPQIRGEGMGAFAAVAQGSAQDARLIRLDYEGPGSEHDGSRMAFLGKAVTFDSGGLTLKSGRDMHEMKFDMGGGAAVIEAIAALAELRVPVRVLGVVGATENMPSGRAIKPGDIVRALDGTTIEVDNADAEGRLVLADCLSYARREGCDRLIDLATLTGAIVTALGSVYAGLMANDDQWARQVEAAAGRAGEPLWRLPLHPNYAQMIRGRYAQLTNRAERREAQAITAAELLHHFAGNVPWAHVDIAGTAYDVPRPYFVGKGATGFGVRLLVELARSQIAHQP
jgi:leucyl aminopeptidase